MENHNKVFYLILKVNTIFLGYIYILLLGQEFQINSNKSNFQSFHS